MDLFVLAESYLCNGIRWTKARASERARAVEEKAEAEACIRGGSATSEVNGRRVRKSSFQLFYSLSELVYIPDLK